MQTFVQLPVGREAVQEVHLVETSDSMRTLQKEKLEPLVSRTRRRIEWYDSLDDVPVAHDKFTVIVAHEFFDALPFHLLQVRIIYNIPCLLLLIL